MDSNFICPHCKSDLLEGGFFEAVNVVEWTLYVYDEDTKKFRRDCSGAGELGDTFTVNCDTCNHTVPFPQAQTLLDLRDDA